MGPLVLRVAHLDSVLVLHEHPAVCINLVDRGSNNVSELNKERTRRRLKFKARSERERKHR